MPIIELFIYSGIFLGIYFAFFVYVTFLITDSPFSDKKKQFLPCLCVLVPCFNEQENIEKTLLSLKNVDYPQEKLEITVIDDGSQDNTLSRARRFAQKHNNVKVIHKEKNGGKYTALNLGIENTKAPFIATVDADSYLHARALKKAMVHFKDKQVKAVIGTVKVEKPQSIIAGIQSVEFLMAAFIRKVFSLVDSINVTPGPLSVFRREVFQELGFYKRAHQTEDLEMAFRLQKANFKIAHAVEAVVFTKPCSTLKTLFRQRLRWRRGFLLNLSDYSELLNIKKHGNLSFLIGYSILGSFIAVTVAGYGLWKIGKLAWTHISNWVLVGMEMPKLSAFRFDWFWFNLRPTLILTLLALGAVVGYIIFSKFLTREKHPLKKRTAFYLVGYPFLNACWWVMAGISILLKKELDWR